MSKCRVLVADNFHYLDVDECHEKGLFDTAEAAISVCRKLVDLSLAEGYKPGMTADVLYDYYTSFGDDPFIRVVGESDERVDFSAWAYAGERCNAICAEA
jgi:hypothetical protein